MEIIWLGHASFLLKNSIGKRLLLDPFPNDIGYSTYEDKVDLIVMSHKHFDHCYISPANSETKLIDTIGYHKTDFCTIKGIQSYHDKQNGLKRGSNIIYIIDMDGFRICHLGDLGHTLDSETLSQIGKIDVLMIPVGGNFTIDGLEAANVATSINSKYIIPMHYKTPELTFELEGPEKFLTSIKNVKKIDSYEFIPDENESSLNNVILFSSIR
jgi:L-ascorbate metabolism protein UlaG (beta-lactamase superfamily)